MRSRMDPRLAPSGPENSLSGVPVEILVKIIKDVDLKGLASLAKVNQHVNFVTIPILYESFHPPEDNAYLFLRTLLTVPALRGYVKRIVLREGVFAEHAFEQKIAVGGADRRLISSHLGQMNLRPAVNYPMVDWRQEEPPEEFDLQIIPIILALLSEVTSLQISHKRTSTMCSDSAIWNAASFTSYLRHRDVHAFTHLKVVQVHVYQAPHSVVTRILAIPTVRSLEFHGMVDFSKPSQLALPLSSDVEQLKLRSAFVDTSILVALITGCNKLKLFLYEHTPICRCGDRGRTLAASIGLDFAALTSALAKHRDSLTDLAILDEEFPMRGRQLRRAGLMDNLTSFPRLENVWVPIWSVLCYGNMQEVNSSFVFPKLFPPKTKHLSLQVTDPCHVEYVTMIPLFYHPDLAEQIKYGYDHLKSVTYGMMEYSTYYPSFWVQHNTSFAKFDFKTYIFDDVQDCACSMYDAWTFRSAICDWEDHEDDHEDDHGQA